MSDPRYVALAAKPLRSRQGLIIIRDRQVHADGTEIRPDWPVLVICATTRRGVPQARCYALAALPISGHPPSFRIVDGDPPKSAEIVAAHAGVTVYRTLGSLRRLAAWWLRHPHGADAPLQALLAMERVILFAAERQELGPSADGIWERYQKLKALALAPGTPGEGEAALRQAVAHAARLAGLEEAQ